MSGDVKAIFGLCICFVALLWLGVILPTAANNGYGSLGTGDPALNAVPLGSDSVGVYDPTTGSFFLKNTNTWGLADVSFGFGAAELVPLVGDWDGDGTDTIGLYDPGSGSFFLKNSNSAGPADLAFGYGAPGLVPLVGDWDGDGTDTVGVYDPGSGSFFLKNSNSAGPADSSFSYGPAGTGIVPVVGDWNGDGVDTIGIYIQATGFFFLTNVNAPGPATIPPFQFGPAGVGWIPLAGNYNGVGSDTIGLYDPISSTFFLKNDLTSGAAHLKFVYGAPGKLPLIGDWDNDEGMAGLPNSALGEPMGQSLLAPTAAARDFLVPGGGGFGAIELGGYNGQAPPDPAVGLAVSFTGPGWLIGGVQSPSLSVEVLIELPILPAIDVRAALRFPPSWQLSVLLTLLKFNSLELYGGAGGGTFPLAEGMEPSLHQLLGVRWRPQGLIIFSELLLEEVPRPRPPWLFSLQLRLGALMRF